MEGIFVDEMFDKLKEIKQGILHNLVAESEDFKAAVEDMGVTDLGDVASNDIDCRTLEALGHQDMLRLQKVESAISRLKNGSYGVCAKCGSMISKNRIEAIPYAVLCIQCKSDSEKHRNRS
ncbi:MAG: TraR/DksA family transcriptional regulator [Spirochaetaceae bacterium]|nr:TraR/DksA family transcriptional regulator [Spirochaetaceae bacterium]